MKITPYRIILFPETIGEVTLCQKFKLEQRILDYNPDLFLFISYLSESEYERERRNRSGKILVYLTCPKTKLEGFFDTLYFSSNDGKSVFLREHLNSYRQQLIKRQSFKPSTFPIGLFLTNLRSIL